MSVDVTSSDHVLDAFKFHFYPSCINDGSVQISCEKLLAAHETSQSASSFIDAALQISCESSRRSLKNLASGRFLSPRAPSSFSASL
jgi:hypothetical protein